VKFSRINFLDHSFAQGGFIHFGMVSDKIYVSQQRRQAENSQ